MLLLLLHYALGQSRHCHFLRYLLRLLQLRYLILLLLQLSIQLVDLFIFLRDDLLKVRLLLCDLVPQARQVCLEELKFVFVVCVLYIDFHLLFFDLLVLLEQQQPFLFHFEHNFDMFFKFLFLLTFHGLQESVPLLQRHDLLLQVAILLRQILYLLNIFLVLYCVHMNAFFHAALTLRTQCFFNRLEVALLL